MKILKVIGFTFIGFLLGCILIAIRLSGIFQPWDEVSDRPNDLKTYSPMARQCDFSTSEFFFTTYPPQNIVECVQEKVRETPYGEVVLRITYARDSNGQVWGWYHSDHLAPGEQIWSQPILGLLVGFITGLFLIRFAKTNTANT